jgi:hypothetical protein
MRPRSEVEKAFHFVAARAKKARFSLRNHTCIKHVTPYSVSGEDSEFA